MSTRTALVLALILVATGGGLGVLLAWLARRRTTLSARNWYLAAAIITPVWVATLALGIWPVAVPLAPFAAASLSASIVGRRWRASDLGAGEDLRRHEQGRRWLWQSAPNRAEGETVYLGGQGELVRQRDWPADEPHVPMTADDAARVPRGDGRHLFAVGGTGSGKTTSVLRVAAGRTLHDSAALLWIDPKGDPPTEMMLRRLAAVSGRPFVLLDPLADDYDHWQPLWGNQPAAIVARLLAGVQFSEPFYEDALRLHIGVVADVLHSVGPWPPSFPLLVEAANVRRFDRLVHHARALEQTNPSLWGKLADQAEYVSGAEGRKAVGGGVNRLNLVVGNSWRDVLAPPTVGTERRAVTLPAAIDAGAIVLWRTWVDTMPREAEMMTALALADIHAAAIHSDRKWTAVLDEAGSVLSTAGPQALSLLQRGRTHGGQVALVTQSVSDIDLAAEKTGLLDSMSDNFAGFVVHRQTAGDSRDWLAKLMGTRALWQSTDQTANEGFATGAGSRRRVREFRVGSDEFKELRVGEAVIYTTLGPDPTTVRVTPVELPDRGPAPRPNNAVQADVPTIDALPPTPSEAQAPRTPRRAPKAQDDKPNAKRRPETKPQPTPETADEATAARQDATDDGFSWDEL